MYRNRNLKKMLCMLLTFTLMISGSALQVMALNPENGLQAAYQDVEAVGAGALEGDSSSETAEDVISVPDAEQMTGEQYSVEDAESTDSSVGLPDDAVIENTEHTSENIADEQPVEETGLADGSAVDSSLADSSLTDSSLTDSSLTDSSLTDESKPEENLLANARNDIEEGIYVIQSALDEKVCIGIAGSVRTEDANAELVTKNGGFAQAFYIKKAGDGVYTFINYNSKKALQAKDAGTEIGTNIQQHTAADEASQKWIIKDATTSGYVTIQSSYCNLQFDCYAGKSAVGTNIHLHKPVTTKRQMWKLVPATGKILAEERLVHANIASGYYTIHLASATSMVLDVAAASTASGANIQIYKSNGTYAQAFQIIPQSNNLYKIRNANSGMYLCSASGTGGASNLVQKKGNSSDKSQSWYILKDPTNDRLVFRPSNGNHAVIGTASNGKTSGTNVADVTFSAGAGQYWTVTKTTVYVKNALYKPACGFFYISPSANLEKVIGVKGGALTNSANAHLSNKSVSNAGKWRLIKNSDETYTIMNLKSGKVLDVSGANFASGTNIHQYTSNGTKAQKWVFRRSGDKDGSFVITSAANQNLVLDISGGKLTTGANAWLYSKNYTAAQKFMFKKTTYTYTGWITVPSGIRFFYVNGKRVTGWRKIGEYYYYFRSTGAMARSTTVSGYTINSEGISNKTDFKTATGGRTIRALLTNAVAPAGKVLYIWGGGWGGMGNSVEADSSKIGMLPTWTTFYNNHGFAGYDYTQYKFNYGMGLDCSGFTAWAVYNTIYDRNNVEDIVASSSGTAAYYISRGWCYDAGNTFKPGDVVSRSGHVWICMGTCTDGSVLIMHSTPEGCQLSGTDGIAIELATKYMKKVSPNWPFHIHQNGRGYLAYVGKATWKTDGSGILRDPDGMQNMTAEQVCKIVFGS